jgi:hypothetical protein
MDTANEDLPDAGTDVPPEPLTAEQRREVYMQAENVFWCWTIFFGAAAVGSSLMSLQILVAVALGSTQLNLLSVSVLCLASLWSIAAFALHKRWWFAPFFGIIAVLPWMCFYPIGTYFGAFAFRELDGLCSSPDLGPDYDAFIAARPKTSPHLTAGEIVAFLGVCLFWILANSETFDLLFA